MTGWPRGGIVAVGGSCDAQGVTEESPASGIRGVPTIWQGDFTELPVQYVTDFLFQLDADGHTAYLTVGLSMPPVIIGDSEEAKRAQVDQITSVPIHAVARFALPRAKFDALIAAAKSLPSAEQFREMVEKATGGAK